MTEIRNEFLDKLIKKSRWDFDKCGTDGYGFRFGPDLGFTHHACYSSFDQVGRVMDSLPFWFYPCAVNDKRNKSIEDREFYALNAIAHPDSPWKPWLDAMPEQFEGYDTPEDKAALIARVGLIFGPTAWKTLNKTEVGCFAVFHRVAYENEGVRNSLKLFLSDERTKDLPLRWNVFAASHIRTVGGDPAEAWGNWHNNFNPSGLPRSAPCYIKTEYTPNPQKAFVHGGNGTERSFMSGNSDSLFLAPNVKGPAKWDATDAQKFDNNFQEKEPFQTSVGINLWYWENKVAPYV